jgi:hypothetical protein
MMRLGGYAGVMAMAGCHPANPLVGKWKADFKALGPSVLMTREFRADGTESMAWGAHGPELRMTYTMDGDTLREHVTGMAGGGKAVSAGSPEMPKDVPKDITETFSVSGDRLTIHSTEGGIASDIGYVREK